MAACGEPTRSFDPPTFLALLIYGDFLYWRAGRTEFSEWKAELYPYEREFGPYLFPVYRTLISWSPDLERPADPYFPVPFLLRAPGEPRHLWVQDLDGFLKVMRYQADERRRLLSVARSAPELILVRFHDPGLADDPEELFALVRAIAGPEAEGRARWRLADPERVATIRKWARVD